jgi:GT2 family glycosyltransferase
METTRHVTYELIVVDNCSKDGSADVVAREFPLVRVLRNDSNVGFAAGQNRGLVYARGRYCLVLNSDVLLKDNSLDALVTFLDGSPAQVGVAGPRILNPDGSLAPSARRLSLSRVALVLSIINRHFPYAQILPQKVLRRLFGPFLKRLHDNFNAHDEIQDVGYVDGMCVLVKREVFENIGLFDEQFFFDFEISDWAIRAHKSGWRVVHYPDAEVVHLGHVSRRLVKPIVLETHRSELIYFTKHFPDRLTVIRATAILVVGLRYFLARFPPVYQQSSTHLQSRAIYGQIIRLLRCFDPMTVNRNGIIPAMPRRP